MDSHPCRRANRQSFLLWPANPARPPVDRFMVSTPPRGPSLPRRMLSTVVPAVVWSWPRAIDCGPGLEAQTCMGPQSPAVRASKTRRRYPITHARGRAFAFKYLQRVKQKQFCCQRSSISGELEMAESKLAQSGPWLSIADMA